MTVLSRAVSAVVGSRAGRAGLAVVAVLVLAIAGVLVLGGDDPASTATDTTTTTTTTSTTTTVPPTTTTTAPTPSGLRFLPDEDVPGGTPAPLTGLRVVDAARLGRPVVAVKVDNLDVPHESARPQVGLARADVVVEEVVEGGITRFVALLHSTDSTDVGPVRSARTTDVHLLPAFGVPLFVFSGANGGTAGAVAASPSIVDRGGEWAPAFHRVDDRRRPHNLMVRPAEVWARGGGTPPGPLGPFVPIEAPAPPGGEAAAGVDLGYVGPAASPVSWRWSAPDRRWVRAQRGTLHTDAEGLVIGPRNVVVLITQYGSSGADGRSPEAVTIGSGDAVVLTRGVLVRGRWERASETDRFHLFDAAGREVPLTIGRTWIELAPPGTTRVVP